MKKLRCALTAVLLLVATDIVQADDGDPPNQNEREVRRLEWSATDGSVPQTMEEYLDKHPLTPARFSVVPRQFVPVEMAAGTGPRISILVDATLALGIQTELNGYVDDLVRDGYAVFVDTVAGGTPAEIKAWVASQYADGSEGVVFIGDITAAWSELETPAYPCDLYYMDLDGDWIDVDGDGDFDQHLAGTGDQAPELYVARLYATTLSYDTEANMINEYLAKTRQYRDGNLKQPWRALEYIDKDWWSMDVALDEIYGSNIDRHDLGYWTTADGYLSELTNGYHSAQVGAHSWSGGHSFSRYPTESVIYANAYVYSPLTQSAILSVGCDNGIKVWVNDSEVMEHQGSSWIPDQYKRAVMLNTGWNRLLCKVSQTGGDFGFSARFVGPFGDPIPNLAYTLSDPATHPISAPFINAWLVNGFHEDVPENFFEYLETDYLGLDEGEVQPYDGQIMGGCTWTSMSAGGAYVDLDAYFGEPDFGVSYAYVTINSNEAKTCQLWLGSTDGFRVWLNGDNIFTLNGFADGVADSTKLNVTLNQGQNHLLIKLTDWMGDNGFYARFANADGSLVDGLSYDPSPGPWFACSQWLVNGPYANEDSATILQQDYLGNETTIKPSLGDSAPLNSWEKLSGGSGFIDLGAVYDGSSSLYSSDIQAADPPALFYNLFACSAGLFSDDNYLAGSYIFNTTYGLVAVASAKTGSMLNFRDYTQPLGEAETFGQAFLTWFQERAPFDDWEQDWYYGMVLNGDPTLRVYGRGDANCDGVIDVFDIDPFVAGLVDPEQYEAVYPNCHRSMVDVNRDGTIDVFDIDPFVLRLVNGNE